MKPADAHLTSSLRRTTGLAGLIAAVVFGAGNALWFFGQPDAGTPARPVLAFYTDSSARIVIGGSLSLISLALFVLFASGVRAILLEREEGDLLATTAFGGALLAMTAGVAAETINTIGALRADAGQLTPELGRAAFEISYVFGYNASGVGIGILLAATGSVALQSRSLLPRWVAVLFVVTGVAFVTPVARFLLAPAVVLLAVMSARILSTARASRAG